MRKLLVTNCSFEEAIENNEFITECISLNDSFGASTILSECNTTVFSSSNKERNNVTFDRKMLNFERLKLIENKGNVSALFDFLDSLE